VCFLQLVACSFHALSFQAHVVALFLMSPHTHHSYARHGRGSWTATHGSPHESPIWKTSRCKSPKASRARRRRRCVIRRDNARPSRALPHARGARHCAPTCAVLVATGVHPGKDRRRVLKLLARLQRRKGRGWRCPGPLRLTQQLLFFLNPLSSSRLYAVKSVYRSALPATARPLVHAARRAAARRAPKIRHKSGQACHLLMMSAVRQQARRTPLRVRLPPLPLRRQPPRLRAQV
jgi:hypothetical protein